MTRVCYIVSDINKALAFEWIAANLNHTRISLSFILIVKQPSELETYLKGTKHSCYTIYYRSKKDLLYTLLRVYKLLRNLHPDVVHCHLLYGSIIGLTAAWLAGIRVRIYTRHHSDFHFRYFPKGIKWDKWCNKLATHIVAPSQVVKEVLTEYEHVPSDKIRVIYHGFDLEYFRNVSYERIDKLKAKFKINGETPVIGVISRFTELKGIQYIIPAFKRLLNKYPEALLLLFNAQGDYESSIKGLLYDVPNKSYRLIPFENDLAAAYQLFDVFIQASTDKAIEAFGQTYVEALASGVPSVFTLSGVAGDFIKDEHNAYVVPFKNSELIYEKVCYILYDYDNAKAIAVQGRKDVADRFSLQKMIHSLEELYEQS